ncbi:AraC family transcriptional regulator [Rhodococcus sp. 14-2496-1d]|uniref:helix-turn-helix domain-containing protein n=1 Tax=Rhodococcus sp. 14-2496-1d TaxID=2023146 RepID=UPI0015C64996|nr:helix-turn-helix domain-containing protein [Rhodococcus sp. 14-2496-1d]
MTVGAVSEGLRWLPSARLRSSVRPYDGYCLRGHAPGEHVGMPSPYLTLIVAIEPEVVVRGVPHRGDGSFETLVGGISSTPVTIVHDGNQYGIQLSLTPQGSRTLLGVPSADLGDWIVRLDDLLGSDAVEMRERVCAAATWSARFDVVDEILVRRLIGQEIDPRLGWAWDTLTGEPASRVADVAREIGWSTRHLISKFTAEYGVSPKGAARIARFHRSHQLLRRPIVQSMAVVAADCGYYDQSHMNRDWRAMAGMAPSVWREREVFAFVQDHVIERGHDDSHD